MKLLQQILSEAGADTSFAYTIIPNFGGYFKRVAGVEDYCPEQITLNLSSFKIKLFGTNLSIGKFFEGDMLILGEIRGTQIE
jgi:hypothetical protein